MHRKGGFGGVKMACARFGVSSVRHFLLDGVSLVPTPSTSNLFSNPLPLPQIPEPPQNSLVDAANPKTRIKTRLQSPTRESSKPKNAPKQSLRVFRYRTSFFQSACRPGQLAEVSVDPSVSWMRIDHNCYAL